MKVYLVDVDNGESYEDYQHNVMAVFTSYRSASEWLINKGYEPFVYRSSSKDYNVHFRWQENNEYMSNHSDAEIIEMELQE